MASDGGHGPRPWTQHQARTNFLRVPHTDWINVSRGLKTEFRASHKSCSALWAVEPPTPVVAYRQHPSLGYDSKLMVLEAKWQEPLAAIGPESLEREGFDSFAEFRRYWTRREKRHFPPTRLVTAYRVRPWTEQDHTDMAAIVLNHLFGEWL